MLGHEGDILEYLLANRAHVIALEAQEFVILSDRLQVDILKTVFHSERLVNLTVDDATFEIKLAELFFHFEEKVTHEKNVHFLDIFHLYCINAINLGDETLWVAFKVIKISRQGFLQDSLLTCVHCLDQEAPIEGRKHERATFTS